MDTEPKLPRDGELLHVPGKGRVQGFLILLVILAAIGVLAVVLGSIAIF